MVKDGYSSAFQRLYFEDKELSARVESFKYSYDEEDDDTCILILSTDDRSDPDKKWFQEKAQLKIIWGFIDGRVSRPIKIYIQDVKWSFTEKTIKATLTCTEKAVSLKWVDSSKVYKNKSMLDITKEIADKHGLKAYVQIDDDTKFKDDIKLDPQIYQTADDYLLLRSLKTMKTVENKKVPENYKVPIEDVLKNVNWDNNFKAHGSVPQANRTDAQLLDTLGRKEKNGPYFVETRGDEMLVKKRNFNQKPYKAYTYGGEDGELQSFEPESKNRGRKGSAINKQFGGWNALDKTHYSGDANNNNPTNSPLLSKMLEQLKLYKTLQQYPKGGSLIAGYTQHNIKHVFIGKNNVRAKGDAVLNYTIRDKGVIPITVDDKITALTKAVNGVNDLIKNYNKTLYDPTALDAEAALANASNSRDSSQLKKNPASATIWGDPGLRVGIIITILGIGKKYSGNYYITKCTHSVDYNNGYMCDVEMVRQGVNIKANEDYIDTQSLNKTTNTQIGPSTTTIKKTLSTKQNPK